MACFYLEAEGKGGLLQETEDIIWGYSHAICAIDKLQKSASIVKYEILSSLPSCCIVLRGFYRLTVAVFGPMLSDLVQSRFRRVFIKFVAHYSPVVL